MQGIYCIKNLINNKVYIGSSNNIEKRFREHKNSLNKNKHHSIYLQRSWNVNGSENFCFTILENVENREDLITREQFYIDKFNSHVKGYNMSPTAGKPFGVKHTEKSRKNMSISHVGLESGMKGKKHSLESKIKIGLSSKGRKTKEETKIKISKALTGIKRSEETKKKMSSAQMGNSKGLGKKKTKEEIEKRNLKIIGQKRSETQRKNMQLGHKSKLNIEKVKEINKLLEKGYSCIEIGKIYNVSRTTISDIKHHRTWVL